MFWFGDTVLGGVGEVWSSALGGVQALVFVLWPTGPLIPFIILSLECVDEFVPGVLSSDADDCCCCMLPIIGDEMEEGDAAFVLLPLLLPGDRSGLSLSWIPCLISFLHFDLRF